MYEILFSVFRATLAYLLLLTVARCMGRKALSQMTFFDFAIIITLGSVTANLAIGQNSTLASSITSLLTLGALAILTGYLHIKSKWIRKITNSEPVTAIANGQIIDKNLKKVRYTIDELTSALREKNIFNINDVEFAIIENEGKLSVLPKSQKQPLTPADMNIATAYKGLTKDIIIDGKIMSENLVSTNYSKQWLDNQLKLQGLSGPHEVFYAGLDNAGNLYVSKRVKGEEAHGQYGIE